MVTSAVSAEPVEPSSCPWGSHSSHSAPIPTPVKDPAGRCGPQQHSDQISGDEANFPFHFKAKIFFPKKKKVSGKCYSASHHVSCAPGKGAHISCDQSLSWQNEDVESEEDDNYSTECCCLGFCPPS